MWSIGAVARDYNAVDLFTGKPRLRWAQGNRMNQNGRYPSFLRRQEPKMLRTAVPACAGTTEI